MTQINLPYNLQDGQKAYAEKVMANFRAIIGWANSGAGGIDALDGADGQTTVQALLDAHTAALAARYTMAESDARLATETNDLLQSVEFNADSGVFSFTKKDGTTLRYDTALEKVPASFELVESSGNHYLRVTNVDGSSSQVNVTALMNVYAFANTESIAFSVTVNNNTSTVTANIRKNSITMDMLALDTLQALAGHTDAAGQSATEAAAAAVTARSWAVGGTGSRMGEDTDNARYWAGQAEAFVGQDGREVQLRASNGYIQWKYDIDATWQNLIALSTLTGATGNQGPQGEAGNQVLLRSYGGFVQWKYDIDASWQNLIALADLKGERGEKGETGRGLTVLGYYTTRETLAAAQPNPAAGDAYGVGAAAPYRIYIWDAVNRAWQDNGVLQGAAGADGKSSYLHIRYAPAADPADGQISSTPNDYLGLCVSASASAPTTAASYVWHAIKGAPGPAGTAGQDGTSSYLHIRWAAVAEPTDSDISETPNAYLGVCVSADATAPTAAARYAWARVLGETGAAGAAASIRIGNVTTAAAGSAAQVTNSGSESAAVLDFAIPAGPSGQQGPAGQDGTSSYLHIRWGASATPGVLLTSPDAYMGVCVSSNAVAPAGYEGYVWYKVKGETGPAGPAGPNQISGETATAFAGLLKGNGTVVEQAVAGTDYVARESDPTVPAWAKEPNKPGYTAAEVGAAASNHTHSNYAASNHTHSNYAASSHTHTAASISGGTFGGAVSAQSNTSYTTAQVRSIQASTSDLTAGSSSLSSGYIYLVYE